MSLPYESWSLLLQFAGAVAVGALGVASLMGGRARPRGAFAFGLFAVGWALSLVLGEVASAGLDLATARTALVLSFAVALPLPYLLLEYASSFARAGARRAAWAAAKVAAVAMAGVGVAALALAPAMVLSAVAIGPDGALVATWGPVRDIAYIMPFYAALGVALVTMLGTRIRAASPRLAVRSATALSGFGVLAGFAAGNNFVYYALAIYAGFATASAWAYVVLFGALGALTVWAGARASALAKANVTPLERRADRWTVAALLVPLGWGAVEAYLAFGYFPRLDTVGLWRLVGTAVLTYGIVRWRMFDLPARGRKAAADATGAGAAVAGGGLAAGAAWFATGNPALGSLLALAVAGVSLVPSLRYVRTLFRVVGEDQDPRAAELRYGQRIDAYRAALENSFARGTIAEDETFLSALRERLGISEAEDHLLRHYAKNVLFVAKAGDIVARFEKLRLLGEGGGGRTWLARDRIRERLVVLKEPLRGRRNDERAREAFLREGRLAAKVRHPNVVRVEEALEENGLLVLVLEYVDGGTLDDLLATRGQLPWRQAVSVAEEILAGLSAIHAVGILHRDVKPSNVLLTEEGTAKIADFGIAIQPDLTKTIQDPTRRMAGTPSYMAPEVLEGAFPTVASDIYGAAATLHAGLFGIPPQGGRLPAFPADAPPQLGAVLARALSADPRMRPPSARVFADELARACGRPLPHRVIVRP